MSSLTSMKAVSYKWLVFSLWILMTLMYITISIKNNSVALIGHKLAELEMQKRQLMIDNNELRDQIAVYSSLNYIEPKAHALGFKKMEGLVFYK